MIKALEAVVGSHAYGLNHAGSDKDYLGVFVEPTASVLSIKGFKETISRTDGVDKEATPDRTFHEVGKFIKLCLAGNPTVTELLWLDEYVYRNEVGNLLIANREFFLSNRIRATYFGYAMQQFKRLQERGNFSSTLKNRTEKHARHLLRLLIQGEKALKTGVIVPRLTEEEILLVRATASVSVSNLDEFNELVRAQFELFDQIESVLPDEPNLEAAEWTLAQIRRAYM